MIKTVMVIVLVKQFLILAVYVQRVIQVMYQTAIKTVPVSVSVKLKKMIAVYVRVVVQD